MNCLSATTTPEDNHVVVLVELTRQTVVACCVVDDCGEAKKPNAVNAKAIRNKSVLAVIRPRYMDNSPPKCPLR